VPFFSTTVFPSLETLRQRVEDVLAPLNYAVDQDVIALHVDLSAGATILGIDRYWIVRFKYTASTLTICQQIESSSSNSFPGTVQSQACSVFGTLPAAVELSVYLVSFLASLLPGFGTVNANVIPPPVPSNTPVITTLPADDPVVVNPGGSIPTSTADPDPSAGINGCFVLWLDAAGRYRPQWFYAVDRTTGQAILDALSGCSRALPVVQWIGLVTPATGSPSTDLYPFSDDELRLAVVFPGAAGGEPFTVPAPLSTILQANQVTADLSAGPLASLKTALLAGLWSKQSMGVATDVLTGLRGAEAPGGQL